MQACGESSREGDIDGGLWLVQGLAQVEVVGDQAETVEEALLQGVLVGQVEVTTEQEVGI